MGRFWLAGEFEVESSRAAVMWEEMRRRRFGRGVVMGLSAVLSVAARVSGGRGGSLLFAADDGFGVGVVVLA